MTAPVVFRKPCHSLKLPTSKVELNGSPVPWAATGETAAASRSAAGSSVNRKLDVMELVADGSAKGVPRSSILKPCAAGAAPHAGKALWGDARHEVTRSVLA